MLVYHGSHVSGLKKLSYTEENSRFGGEANLVHGAGIYLTVSKEEARAYATSSLYTLEVSGDVFDATDREVLQEYVVNLLKSWKVSEEIVNHKTIQNLIRQTSLGESSGVVFAKNLGDVFANEIDLYGEILQERFLDDVDALCSATESSFSYRLIKVRHKGNQTDWVICLDHEGLGLEILEEETIESV